MSPSTGNYSPLNVQKGSLTEYTNAETPLELTFEFNPLTITRTRSVNVQSGTSVGTRGDMILPMNPRFPEHHKG